MQTLLCELQHLPVHLFSKSFQFITPIVASPETFCKLLIALKYFLKANFRTFLLLTLSKSFLICASYHLEDTALR